MSSNVIIARGATKILSDRRFSVVDFFLGQVFHFGKKIHADAN